MGFTAALEHALLLSAPFGLLWLGLRQRRVQRQLARLQQQREEQLRHQTLHDPLTGLGNRRLLTETLDSALRTNPGELAVALLFVDLDGFKQVNDMYGHDVGDLVLVEVSRRIAEAVRGGDLATRLGGDEFVVLCVGLVDESSAVAVARRIERAVAQAVSTPWGDVRVTASIGIACSAEWPRDAEQLLHEADIAMYRAKQLGKRRCQLFDKHLRQSIAERANAELLLRDALETDRVALHYQPIYDLNGTIRSVEALLRVTDPNGNVLPPAPIIAVAEELGLIHEVTDRVLRMACAQVAEWHTYAPHVTVSVNISGRDVGHHSLRESVFAALAEANVAPKALILELTETALLEAGPQEIAQLQEFMDAGIHVGMDDFGTGYTSLQQLRHLPVNFVKLDRSFVAHLPDSRADRAIVVALAALAEQLGLQCVAEGVETRAQFDCLADAGVGYTQGYFLARPGPAASVSAQLAPGVTPLPAQRPPRQSNRVSA